MKEHDMSIEIGQLAPDFTLATDTGAALKLSDLRNKKVILYFYPKDNTPGCTKEACEFRDVWKNLEKKNVVILGVSKDSAKSHTNFKQKFELPFTLLSDTEGKVCEQYGVMVEKQNYGKKYRGIERSTFLIDEKGMISAIWRKVKVDGHIPEILETLKK